MVKSLKPIAAIGFGISALFWGACPASNKALSTSSFKTVARAITVSAFGRLAFPVNVCNFAFTSALTVDRCNLAESARAENDLKEDFSKASFSHFANATGL